MKISRERIEGIRQIHRQYGDSWGEQRADLLTAIDERDELLSQLNIKFRLSPTSIDQVKAMLRGSRFEVK